MGPEWFWPPEVVAGILEASDPSTVIANIAAWLAEAIQYELSMGLSAANIAATMSQWLGLGGAAYGATGTGLNFGGLLPLAAHCLKHVAIGQAAVEANALARSTVVPAVICQANRAECATDIHINPAVFGALTPRIGDLNGEYGEFWAQNTGAGVAFGSTLNALTAALAVPPPVTPFGAAPAAGEAVAQSAANSGLQASYQAVQRAGEAVSSPGDAVSQLLQPVQQAVSSAPELAQSVGKVPTQLLGSASLMGMFPSLAQQSPSAAATVATEAVAEPIAAGSEAASGLGTAGGAGVGYPGAGLTSYTRPTSSFAPDIGGRPTGLRPGALLSAAEVRGPTTSTPMGGAAMPMAPAAAGMLARANGDSENNKVAHARIVIDSDRHELR
jgi:hypothetical protein